MAYGNILMGNPLMGVSIESLNAGGLGKNCDSQPISGFGFDDWRSVINSFDCAAIYSTKCGYPFIALSAIKMHHFSTSLGESAYYAS